MHSCIPIHALINTLEDKIPPTADNTDTDHHASIQKPRVIPLLKSGVSALQAESDRLGLGFDDWQIEWCRHLFQDELRRDPTEVELFDIGQSNSEHCRHWFFNGQLEIDGEKIEDSLMDLLKSTLLSAKQSNPADNSLIAFEDNSSGIRGQAVQIFLPSASLGKPYCTKPRLR